ncbi:MAG: Zn-ribbon domain-containing OB-fold protein [Pseudomonadota bacterium]|nr:Zn-ribbon domain-containing OB-fold protein [Pseudomonadota bacterium]
MTSYISMPIFNASIDERLRLIAGKCQNCGELAYPQRPVCINCGGSEFVDTQLSGEGTLYTFSLVAGNSAPSEFDDEQIMTGDILCGVVELKEGPRVMVRIAETDPDSLEIGMAVRAVVRRLYDQEGIIRYGTKFVLEK